MIEVVSILLPKTVGNRDVFKPYLERLNESNLWFVIVMFFYKDYT